jgi:hypothetical protein
MITQEDIDAFSDTNSVSHEIRMARNSLVEVIRWLDDTDSIESATLDRIYLQMVESKDELDRMMGL